MKELISRGSASDENSGHHSRWPWFLAAGCVLVILMARLSHRQNDPPGQNATLRAPGALEGATPRAVDRARRPARGSSPAPGPTAEEIVSHKVNQFARNRLEIL